MFVVFISKLHGCTSSSFQCSECVEGYLGTPVNGHQCYEQMGLDHPYVFANIKEERTKFYAIHPKYFNVDIRVVIDVNQGGSLLPIHISNHKQKDY